MNDLSILPETGRSINATKGMASIVGVVIVLISIVLIIVGNISPLQGQVAPGPDGGSSYTTASSAGYADPSWPLGPVGILGLVLGIGLVVEVAATKKRRKTPRIVVDPCSAGYTPQRIGKREGSHDPSPRLPRVIPSQPEGIGMKSEQTTVSGHGRYPRIRASEQILHDSPVLQPGVASSETLRMTSTGGRGPWMVEFVVPRPRSSRIELELRLSQLKSWKERGLITKKNYEEEKIKVMRRLHPPLR